MEARAGVEEKVVELLQKPEVTNTAAFVKQDEIAELKENINCSFEELVSVILEANRQIEDIKERMELYNRKSSHKI